MMTITHSGGIAGANLAMTIYFDGTYRCGSQLYVMEPTLFDDAYYLYQNLDLLQYVPSGGYGSDTFSDNLYVNNMLVAHKGIDTIFVGDPVAEDIFITLVNYLIDHNCKS